MDHEANPLIHPEPPDWVIADPTFIPPSDSPDGLWHLFAHGVLSGLNHFISNDGIKWANTHFNIASGIRPFLYKEGEIYYLLYEKLFTLLLGSVVLSQSVDLFNWTNPKVLLAPTYPWEGVISRRVGNPCLLKVDSKYRLYYSAGSIFIWDTLFYEPKYIGVAEAKALYGPYEKVSRPIISPAQKHPYRNIASGAIKVLRVGDLWVGFNNGIYKDSKGRSRSSILLLHSQNGLEWTDVFPNPILAPTTGWKKAFIYQCDVRKVGDSYWLYFNARDGWIVGTERIGLARLTL